MVHSYKFYHCNNQLFYSSQDNNSRPYNPHNLLITYQPIQPIKSFSYTLILGYKDMVLMQYKQIYFVKVFLTTTRTMTPARTPVNISTFRGAHILPSVIPCTTKSDSRRSGRPVLSSSRYSQKKSPPFGEDFSITNHN